MNTKNSHSSTLHIARITLQTETPLSISTGQADGVFDSTLVVDANGLPAIPGSSLAGVLRHLFEFEYADPQATEHVFGYQDKQKSEASTPSKLRVSWGCIQDSNGKPIEGLQLGEQQREMEADSILRVALSLADTPVNRDRVKISHRGTSGDMVKFERTVLPAGYRFSIELSQWGEQHWNNVLKLFHHPLFRLGGSTRAGLGKISVHSMHHKTFDLAHESGRQAFKILSRDIGDTTNFSEHNLRCTSSRAISAAITLNANSYWRFGQGDRPLLEDGGDAAQLLPKVEQRIEWTEDGAAPAGESLLISGASVKGALAHRIAFHANRLAEKPVWADKIDSDVVADYDKSEHCDAVRELFGYANDSSGNKLLGQAGRVLIDDSYRIFSQQDLQKLTHNSIDRFSGSVRDHMLFCEEMVWGGDIEIKLTIQIHESISQLARDALLAALDDLKSGRLALGAGSAKGHGFFTGDIEWYSIAEKWLEGEII